MKGLVLGSLVAAALGLFTAAGLSSVHTDAADVLGAVDVKLEEIFRTGHDADEEGPLFSIVRRIAVNSEGLVYVANWGSASVYVLSQTGQLVSEIGREGRGPGEFDRVDDVFVDDGDAVIVWDGSQWRVTVFTPSEHRVAETISVAEAGASHPSRLIGVVREGFLVSFRTPYGTTPEWAPELERSVDVFLLDRNGRRKKGLPLASLPERESITKSTASTMSVSVMPFGRIPQFTLGPDELLYSGWNDAIKITVQSMDGATQRILEHEHEALPVTSADLSELFDNASEGRRRTLRETTLPKTKPAYRQFVVADDGRLWVQLSAEHGASTAACLILNADGSVLDTVDLPSGLRLEAIRHEKAYGVLTTDDGIPLVAGYAITM